MANTIFKASLQAAKFPPRYSQAKRGVVNTGSDQSPRIPVSYVGTSESLDYNMIELQYSQNTLPTDFGVTSFGIVERLPAVEETSVVELPDTISFYLPPLSEDGQPNSGDWSRHRRTLDFFDGVTFPASGGLFPGAVATFPGASPGNANYIRVPYDPVFDFSGDFEISAWVNLSSKPGAAMCVVNLYSEWAMGFDIATYRPFISGPSFNILGAAVPEVGEWHFLRWVFSGGVHYLFMDEVLQGTGAGAAPISATWIYWGRKTSGSQIFHGKMQDLVIDTGGVYSTDPIELPTAPRFTPNIPYSPTLVPAHVKYMAHLETNELDSSQSKLVATRFPATTYAASAASVGQRGLLFSGNGTNDGYSIPFASLPWAGSFWISFKAKVLDLASSQALMTFGSGVAAAMVLTTGQIAWWEGTTQVAVSSATVAANQFFELAVSHDGAGNYTVFLNGTQVILYANGSAYVPTDWMFGKRGTSNPLRGCIDEIYFSTEQEYSGTYTPSTVARFPLILPALNLDQLLVLRTSLNRVRLMIPSEGNNWLFDTADNRWTSVPVPELPKSVLAGVDQITSAPISGGALVCYAQAGIIKVSASGMFTEYVNIDWPAGVSIGQIRGICWALNYLIAWTSDQILWSTPLDPFNFSDTAQGAGSATPLDLKGAITVCQPIAGGLIIYTGKNAVGATYTENAIQPFRYKEVRNSGGCVRVQHLTGDYNGGLHYTYGPTGFQKVTLSEAVTVFPELSDALSQPVVQAWNETTSRVEEFSIPGAVEVSMDFLANRYLCISAEVAGDGFKYMSYIYDTVLERWGTLVHPHIRMFMLPNLETATDLQYNELIGSYASLNSSYSQLNAEIESATPGRSSIAFMAIDGSVQVLDFAEPGESVVIYGRAQLLRSQAILLNWVELDGISDNTTVTALSSSTGHSRDGNLELSKISDYEGYGKYAGRIGGINLDFVVKGKFALSSLIVNAQSHGRVRVIADVAAPPPPI